MTGENLKDTVNRLFTVVRPRSSSHELVFICPEPTCGDQSGNRSVNLRTGKTGCWRCNKGGDFVIWARRMGHVIEDDRPTAQPLESIDITGFIPLSDPAPPVMEVTLPKGFIPCSEKPHSVYSQLIGEMAETKNLTIEDFFEAGVGYTKTPGLWEPYAIFPVTEYARTVYYQGRTYVDVPGESTKRFPSRHELRYGSKYWVYNIDEVKTLKPPVVIVVESILNVLSLRRFLREHGILGVVPVAVFKHSVSRHQALKLFSHDSLEEVCLLYDHDASRMAWDKSQLLSDRLKLTIAEMPPGENNKRNDPNDDVVAAFKAFEERKPSTKKEALIRSLAADFQNQPHKEIEAAEDKATISPLEIAGQLIELLDSDGRNTGADDKFYS